MEFYKAKLQDIYAHFSSSRNGLSTDCAKKRLLKNGKNELKKKKESSFLKKFIVQLCDFMVIVLLLAAAISFFAGLLSGEVDYAQPIIILAIVVVNALIGVFQEDKASRAIEALSKISAPSSKVLRDGKIVIVPSNEIVTGDILILSTGDYVPADARIIECNSLSVDESSLTGESVAVSKDPNFVGKDNIAVADRKNMLISSSLITSGNAVAIAVATGMDTEIGRIAYLLQNTISEETPLQKRLAKTGKILGISAIIICIIIFLTGLIEGRPFLEMLLMSVSLAVAAIPEGLVAVVTIVLAIGVSKMVQENVIVRKLPAVETLGCATVICSDKTGTLTLNKMTVTSLFVPFSSSTFQTSKNANLLLYGGLCNNSNISTNGVSYSNPTDIAIFECFSSNAKNYKHLLAMYTREYEIPFSSDRKMMTTIHKKDSKYYVITKGALDFLIEKCKAYEMDGVVLPLDNEAKQKILTEGANMASKALRVIALAYKIEDNNPQKYSDIESGLVFCGLFGIIDPPRHEVKDAVLQCKRAGIKTVMITGDHILTAKAIADELGILGNGKLLTGAEIENMSSLELKNAAKTTTVFARVAPEHKSKIVRAFKASSNVVAMTGDGVNDAPALKAADIGCAMGITGTEVAKSAADIILTDDNFTSIVSAVKFGRGVYNNIRRCIHFLLSSNIGEIITILFSFILNFPTPLLPIHLLWVNLVTDSLPALALGTEKVQDDVMNKKPIDKNKSFFAGGLLLTIFSEGFMIGSLSLLAFIIGYSSFDLSVGRTMCFTVLSLSQLVHAYNMRSEGSVFKIGIFSNIYLNISVIICCALQVVVVSVPAIAKIFNISVLSFDQWITVILLSLVPILVVEISKLFSKEK